VGFVDCLAMDLSPWRLRIQIITLKSFSNKKTAPNLTVCLTFGQKIKRGWEEAAIV